MAQKPKKLLDQVLDATPQALCLSYGTILPRLG